MTAGAARAAIGVTLGEPTLSAGGSIVSVPVTVSCSPFDASLTTFTTLVSVTVEQGQNGIARANGALSAGFPTPMVFACDGTSQTLTVTAVGEPNSPRFHPGPAVVSVLVRAMAGIPCPERPLCFGFVDTQSTSGTSTVQLMATTPEASGTQELGARIGVFGGATQTFPAGQPFHFSHGWQVKPDTDGPLGLWAFSLTLDGVQMSPDFIEERQIDDPVFGHLIHRVYVFNFPNGLTGTHVFAGTFWGPCSKMVAEGLASGPCATPNAVIAADGFPVTTRVTFMP
jgi:hypothetical protein